jgi:hypothetical protein
MNPKHEPSASAVVVEHLLRAARGVGESVDVRSWFTGRTAEVDAVVSWVGSGLPGLRVMTAARCSSAPTAVVDLDAPQFRESGAEAMRHYIIARLSAPLW